MAKLKTALIFLPIVVLYGAGAYYVIRFWRFIHWGFAYDYMEVITLIGLLLFFGLQYLEPTLLRRPFGHVPPEASWWEYLVFGMSVSVFAGLWWIALLAVAAIVLLPLPAKWMMTYVLGEHATITSAIFAFPLIFCFVSVTFTGIYLWFMTHEMGNLTRNNKDLYSGLPGVGWPFAETYYFSLSTMLKGAPQYEATGWCRWIALAEIAVARIMEIAIVTVGIGLIVRRTGVGSHLLP